MAFNTRIQHKIDTAAGWEGSSITLLDGELALVKIDGKVRMKVGDGSSTYASLPFFDQDANTHIANKNNPHGVTKEQLGLGNVNNTADANKTVKAANALTVVSKGSATTPVYFDANGVPVACTYSLGKSVPSDAVFTDTVYTHPSHTAQASGLYKITVDSLGHISAATAVAKADITGLGIPAQDTVYTHPASHAASMITGLATVATSGKYSDLSGTPNVFINTYSDYRQLGFTETPTLEALIAAVPASSIYMRNSYTSSYSNLPADGLLTISKGNDTNTGFVTLARAAGATTEHKRFYVLDWYKDMPSDKYEWRETAYLTNGVLGLEQGGTGAKTKLDAQTALGLNNAIVGLSVSGKTITYTQADGGTDTITTQDTTYTLPAATTEALGGVKVGTNISVSSGTISVANGSTSTKGVVKLSSSTSSTSTSLAATASAVKAAYDLANGKQSPATTLSGYGITDAYTKTEVDTKVAGLVDSAPEALNTLNELAAALGNDANFSTTVSNLIGKKADASALAKVATSGSYNDLSNKPTIPTSLPANGGNAATVGGFTVGCNVPADAVFTDTVYTHPTYTAKSSGLYKITVNNLGHVSAATAVAKSDITGLGIPAQDTVYTHPSHTAKSSGLYKITVDSLGHVSAATAVAKADITGLGIPAQDTVYTHPASHAASMITGLATVATSGSYTDLSNKPSIPAVTKVTFTASDSKWGALSNGRYPLTISASGGEFLNCYRTNGSNYDKMDVNVTVSGNNIIIYSLDKFAGYVTYIK